MAVLCKAEELWKKNSLSDELKGVLELHGVDDFVMSLMHM